MIPTDLKNLPNYALTHIYIYIYIYLIVTQTRNVTFTIFSQQVLGDKLLLILTCHLSFIVKILQRSISFHKNTDSPSGKKGKKEEKKKKRLILFPMRGGSG